MVFTGYTHIDTERDIAFRGIKGCIDHNMFIEKLCEKLSISLKENFKETINGPYKFVFQPQMIKIDADAYFKSHNGMTGVEFVFYYMPPFTNTEYFQKFYFNEFTLLKPTTSKESSLWESFLSFFIDKAPVKEDVWDKYDIESYINNTLIPKVIIPTYTEWNNNEQYLIK